MTVGLPICVESILLFRLLAVYPPSRTPRLVLYSIFGPLLLLKLGRIINAIIFFTEITSLAHQFPSSIAAAQVAWDRPGDKIEWILQVLDNSWVVARLSFQSERPTRLIPEPRLCCSYTVCKGEDR
jgi:hypothetical protein